MLKVLEKIIILTGMIRDGHPFFTSYSVDNENYELHDV